MKIKLITLLALSWALLAPAQTFNAGTNALAQNNWWGANTNFAGVVASSPTNEDANLLWAATRLLTLPQTPAGSNFLVTLGFPNTNRWLPHIPEASLPKDINGYPIFPANYNSTNIVAFFRTNIMVAIAASGTNLANVTDPNYTLTLSSNETGIEAVTLDYGDIQMMRALLSAAQFMGYTLNANNFSVVMPQMANMFETHTFTWQWVLTNYPNLLTMQNTADLALSKSALTNAIGYYFAASSFIRNTRPAGATNRLFELDTNDIGMEAKLRTDLTNVLLSLNTPTELNTNSVASTIYAGSYFSGTNSLRGLMPQFNGWTYVDDTLPSYTFGGILPYEPAYKIESLLRKEFYSYAGIYAGQVYDLKYNDRNACRFAAFVSTNQQATIVGYDIDSFQHYNGQAGGVAAQFNVDKDGNWQFSSNSVDGVNGDYSYGSIGKDGSFNGYLYFTNGDSVRLNGFQPSQQSPVGPFQNAAGLYCGSGSGTFNGQTVPFTLSIVVTANGCFTYCVFVNGTENDGGYGQLGSNNQFTNMASASGSTVIGTLNSSTFQITGTVTNAYGGGTWTNTRSANVPFDVPPVITTNLPANITAVAGTNVTLFLVATGSPPMCFQWYSNGVAIPNATTNTLVVSNLQFSSAGTYSVSVNNAVGGTNAAVALMVVATPDTNVTFTITPSAVSNTYIGTITLQVTGLNSNETVTVQKYLDLNTNGVIDGNDWLVQQFTLTDGQAGMVIGGVTNFNVPGDTDGSANGQITATLNFQNGDFAQDIVGKYLYRISSPVGLFAPTNSGFSVTNFPFAQKFTGNVLNSVTGTTVSNACVLLLPSVANSGGPLAGTMANSAGSYTLMAPPGTYSVMAFGSNYVANMGGAPVITLNSGQTLTTNLSVIPATASISGSVVDANNSSVGLPGINMLAQQPTNGLIGLAFTDTNGNYTLPVTAGSWTVKPSGDSLLVHGYLGLKTNVNAGATGVTLAIPKATALIYGSIKDNLGNPFPVLEADTDDSDGLGLYETESFTDANGNYVMGVVGGAGDSWWMEANGDDQLTNYVFTPDHHANPVSINAGQAVLRNFTGILATNHITGWLKDNNGNPITGIEIYASATINGLEYDQEMDTDNNGNYWLNVPNGSWDVQVAPSYWGSDDSLPANYVEPADQYPVIANNNATVNFTATRVTGSLQVTITPAGAITNGAEWQVDGGLWQSSGATVTNLFVGNHTVSFSQINGWTTPTNQTIAVSANSIARTTGNYVQAQSQSDSINWGAFGPQYTSVASGTTIPSVGGSVHATVYASNGFETYIQSSGWSGSFTPGENLLYDKGSPSGVTVVFSSGISGLIVDLENDDYGSFTYSIAAYDTSSNYLGTVTGSGTTTSAADGSEPKANVGYSNIGRIVITTTADGGEGFAIGNLTFEPYSTKGYIDTPRRSLPLVQGDTLRFTGHGVVAANAAPIAYYWNFGDGRSSLLQNPGFVSFPNSGVFNVSLNVTNALGKGDPHPPSLTFTVVSPTNLVPDLQPIKIIPPATFGIGQSAAISYIVTNNGPGVLTNQSWMDAIYLSTRSTLDNSATLLTNLVVSNNLAVGGTYTNSAQFIVPSVSEGSYYLIASVDDQGQILEQHKLNNELATNITAAIPSLTNDVPHASAFANDNASQYYQMNVPAGQTLTLSLNKTNNDGITELYVRYGSLPTRSTYDYRSSGGSTANPSVLIPSTMAGTLYILAYGADIGTSGSYIITPHLAPLILTSIGANQLCATQAVTFAIFGAGFAAGDSMALINTNGTPYPATTLVVNSSTLMTVSFAANSVPPGLYSVRVSGGGGSATLTNVLTLQATGLPHFDAYVVPPGLVGYHMPSTFYVVYTNSGTASMPAPLVVFTMTQNGLQYGFLTLDSSKAGQSFWTPDEQPGFSHWVQFLAGGAMPGVLQPGESGRIAIYYAGWKQNTTIYGTGLYGWDPNRARMTFCLTTYAADNPLLIDWTAVGQQIRPNGATNAASWSATLTNLENEIGLTWGSYVGALDSTLSTLLSQGGTNLAISNLFAVELQQAETFSYLPPRDVPQTPCNDCSSNSINSITVPGPQDPNAKIGPVGYGPQGYVAVDSDLPYVIYFENSTNATVPAQQVFVWDYLSTSLDWNTFELGGIGFGSEYVPIPPASDYFATNVMATINGVNIEVQIEAGIDFASGKVFANFTSLDPVTQLPPPVNIGFLPPDDGTGIGMGYVSFVISPKPNLYSGTQITNVAYIQFDEEPVIATDLVDDENPALGMDTNKVCLITIDAGTPTSHVLPLPAMETNLQFTVQWTGADDTNGSGIQDYIIYYSTNGVTFNVWLANTTNTSATFIGYPGMTNYFYSIAEDNVGYVENKATLVEAQTFVPTNAASLSAVVLSETLNTNMDRQTGLFYQQVVVCNPGPATFTGLRFTATNLMAIGGTNLVMWNATGTNNSGQPYMEETNSMPPGSTNTFTLSYYSKIRRAPVGVGVLVEVMGIVAPTNNTGTTFAISKLHIQADGKMAFQFSTLAGRTYIIQYSGNLLTWNQAQSSITGNGLVITWVDAGPPDTEINHANSRYYRVLLLPQ